MPVHVQVPIRLRLASADLADMDVVEEAVAEAVRRALARSREAVVEPRGAFARPVLQPPTYLWTGRAGDVAPPARAELEMRIARAVWSACGIARLTELVDPRDADEVLPREIRERFDPARWDRRTRSYEIPSYQRASRRKKTTRALMKSDKPPGPVRMVRMTKFVRASSKTLWDSIGAAAARQFPSGLPARVALLLEGANGMVNVYLATYTAPRLDFLYTLYGGVFDLTDPKVKAKPSIDPGAAYTFQFEMEGDALGHETFRASLRQSYLDKHGKRGALAGEEAQGRLLEQARKYVEEVTAGFEERVAAYYVLKRASGDIDFRKPISKTMEATVRLEKSWPVLSVTEEREVAVEGDAAEDGGGGEADAGKGLGKSGLEEYGEYEGGAAGGIGIALAAGGYSAKAPLYPMLPGERGYELRYERYSDEPPLDALGDAGQRMRRLIEIIARMLDIPGTTPYAAGFAIAAARIVAERAQQVTRYSMDDRAEGIMLEATSIGAEDPKGHFYFKPVPSVAIQYLQHLARVIPLIRQLTELVLVHIGRRPDTYFAWGYHFFEQVADNAFDSCKHLFIYACQITLLQYLRTTRSNIYKRRANLDVYVKTFAVLVDSMLADQTELVLLRNALDRHISGAGRATGEAAYGEAARSMVLPAMLADNYDVLEAKLHERDLMLELTDPSDFVQRRGEQAGRHDAGEIVRRGETWAIRDSKGKDWTLDEMDRAIDLKRRSVERIDPLVTRVTSYPDQIRPLVDDPTKIREFVVSILDAMETKNLEVTRKVEGEYEYAFEHGIFREANKNAPATGGHSRWSLQGVHQMADNAVGPALAYDLFYVAAVDSLISHEVGMRQLLDDLCFVGSIALSIFCPPLGAAFGFVSGMVMGYVDYEHAKELQEIHEAVLDPEKLLNRAEIEIMIFCAKISMALSFVSLVPGFGKGASKAGAEAAKRALREGAEEGIEVVAKRSARRIAVNAAMAELRAFVYAVKSNLAGALVMEVIEEKLEDVIVSKIMERVIDARLAELAAEARAAGVR